MSQCYICAKDATEKIDYYRKEAHMCKEHNKKISYIFEICFDFEIYSRKPNLLTFCRYAYKNGVLEKVIQIIRDFISNYNEPTISRKKEYCNKCSFLSFKNYPSYVEKEDREMQLMCKHKAEERISTHYMCIYCNYIYIIKKDIPLKEKLLENIKKFPEELVNIIETYNIREKCHNCEYLEKCIKSIQKIL